MGETGSGKEVFAQAIHNASDRKEGHFIAVNCSSFSKELLESEMFGHKAGAFTGAVKNKKGLFEETDKGTLLLDEIGELDISLQAKLLSVLETNSFIKQCDTKLTNVDVRIIAATNRTIEDKVAKGNFRKDLYYRLSVVRLEIPSLRDREEDIVPLTYSFIKYFSTRLNKTVGEVDPEFLAKLKEYKFPGNVRELRNIVERAVIISEVQNKGFLPSKGSLFIYPAHSGNEVTKTLDENERQHIIEAMSQATGNKQKAAEMLGIGLTTLYRKLYQY